MLYRTHVVTTNVLLIVSVATCCWCW